MSNLGNDRKLELTDLGNDRKLELAEGFEESKIETGGEKEMSVMNVVREWVALPFVAVGFLIHLVGVAIATFGSLISDGPKGAAAFWSDHIRY